MRSQAFSDQQKTSYLNSQKTMEINPRHPIVIELNEMIKGDAESEIASDSAWLLYDTALLQSGFQQDDVESFSMRMFRTMKAGMNLKSLDLADEIEVELDEEEEEEGDEGDAEDIDEEGPEDEL